MNSVPFLAVAVGVLLLSCSPVVLAADAAQLAPSTTGPATRTSALPAWAQPTRVTLDLKNVPLATALAELGKQATYPFTSTDEHFWERDHPPITLQVKQVPLWEAVLAVCRQAKLVPMTQGLMRGQENWAITLGTDEPLNDLAVLVRGPVMYLQHGTSRFGRVKLGAPGAAEAFLEAGCLAHPEPKLWVNSRDVVAVGDLSDDAGTQFISTADGWLAPRFRVPDPARPLGHHLPVLRLRCTTKFAGGPDLEVADVTAANGVTLERGGFRAEVSGEEQGHDCVVRIVLHRKKDLDREEFQTSTRWFSCLRVLDADGFPLTLHFIEGGTGGTNSRTFAGHFSRHNRHGAPMARGPFKLLWGLPQEEFELMEQVEFRKVPLP